MKSTVYLSPEELAPIVANGKGTLVRPIVADHVHIETLPGEEGPSAWTVERYLKGGKAYQRCARLYPFDRQDHGYLRLKVKWARKAHYFKIASCRVVKEKGSWVWVIEVEN